MEPGFATGIVLITDDKIYRIRCDGSCKSLYQPGAVTVFGLHNKCDCRSCCRNIMDRTIIKTVLIGKPEV